MNKRQTISLIAGVLALVLSATPASAQYRGGWGGGYYHGGYGGWGGYYPSYGPVYYGSSYGYGYPWYGGIGLGYPGYFNGGYYYGGVPYYSNWGYYGLAPREISINTTGGVLSNYQVQFPISGPVVASSGSSDARQSFYSGPSPSVGKADLTVKVPADAQVWVGSIQSGQAGTKRRFSFPDLQGNTPFTLRASWTENGQAVTREKQVDMRPGANETVDLTQPASGKTGVNPTTGPRPAPGSAADSKKGMPTLPATGVPKQ